MATTDDLVVAQEADAKLIYNFVVNTDKLGASKLSKNMLKTRLQLLDNYWNTFRNRHQEIVLCIADVSDTPYVKEDRYTKVELAYSEAHATLTDRVEVLEPPSTNLPSATFTPQQQQQTSVASHQTALPKLSLPTFSGDQLDWETFKEQFTAMVINVDGLQGNVKLQHLTNCLQGEAAIRVKNLQVTNANFEVAWDALKRRYDNSRVRLGAQLSHLTHIPPMARKSAAEISRVLDSVDESVRSLRILGRPVDKWDDWFVHIIESRLDQATREDWAKSLENNADFATYDHIVKFLESRARSLESTGSFVKKLNPTKPTTGKQTSSKSSSSSSSVSAHHVAAEQNKDKVVRTCSCCQLDHALHHCPKFGALTQSKRFEFLRQLKACLNCFRIGHYTESCRSPGRCRVDGCGAKHHTLLHQDKLNPKTLSPPSSDSVDVTACTSRIAPNNLLTTATKKVTLLATANVVLESPNGQAIAVRALIDPGSEGSFITESVAQALHLRKTKADVTVGGVGGEIATSARAHTYLFVKSPRSEKFSLSFSALILPKLTSMLPRLQVELKEWPHLKSLPLADPEFATPARIDCLLGADVYGHLLLNGVRKGNPCDPVAQQTVFGWMITGPASGASDRQAGDVACHHISTSTLEFDLKKFWELEEIATSSQHTPDEQACEDHYVKTHQRDSTGRYVVRLPFRKQPLFPGIQRIATSRFLQGERRREAEEDKLRKYVDFMEEYSTLGHMEPTSDNQAEGYNYYLPHHAVFRQDGRIRVVFNASQTAANGSSLNDCLYTGPKLQTDVSVIISRWRFFKYVFSADIVKMFRQFRLHHEDADWQRIVWRNSSLHPLQHFKLTTVTYGTACAPYLAIRTLLQLARDSQKTHPLGASALEHHFYVDDALAGADSIEEAMEIQKQLTEILDSAGMQLDKWKANDAQLLSLTGDDNSAFHLVKNDATCTLGLYWRQQSDTFTFKLHRQPSEQNTTKRGILSEVARLYDPLGWLAPVILLGKMLIQMLWIRGADWDQPVDDDLRQQWTSLRDQLQMLEKAAIPRWLGLGSSSLWTIHGFCDASERAYAAAIYLVAQQDGYHHSALLVAKTKLAPIKTVSIPRLELCGALLLAELIAEFCKQLLGSPQAIFCWTDSMVVLVWLKGHPSRWTTFVANRVSKIVTMQPDAHWQHVRSQSNPADLASRGLLPDQLIDNTLWWNGPDLLQHPDQWTVSPSNHETTLEEKRIVKAHLALEQSLNNPFEALICHFSSLSRLVRTVAYMLRWRANAAKKNKKLQAVRPLDGLEITMARTILLRANQLAHLPQEYEAVKKGDQLPRKSSIRRFNPFIDDNGVMRVGGRLQNAYLGMEEKHPAIVPSSGQLAELLIRDAHKRTLHGGTQLVMSYLLRSCWVIHARNRIRRMVHQCIRCERHRAVLQTQLMAPLPAARITPSRPFTETGLDYASPFWLRTSKGRGQKAYKGYIAIFICMVTRAIHIEVVSDLTSKTFLLAFRRFVARRGLCKTVWCDNATTFVGASKELKQLFNSTSAISQEIADLIALDGVSWRFIPPRAPHFGGMWEAAVKSFKHHLRRVLGDAKLTFEEFSTLSSQIEACLNSRPLSELSSDPSDLTALTPGHFLIGAPLLAPPEPHNDLQPITGVPRYLITTQMRNHFWDRWYKEVISQYQRSGKWNNLNTSIKVGSLVLVTEENYPPNKWPLARVQQLHPGRDGLTRVVTIKTATSTFQRPIHKLVLLPVDTNPGQRMAGGHTLNSNQQPASGGTEDGGRHSRSTDHHQDSQ